MATLSPHKEPLLIVEDDPVSRKILAQVAENAGFAVQACADGEEGWAVFQRERPRIVVLDWLLAGGTDGVSLCRKIRRAEGGRFVTILMVTVQDRSQDLEEALTAGVTYYMTKPVKRDFFRAWLAAARKNSEDMRALEEHEAATIHHRLELESLNAQLEQAIDRANQMAAEASRAYIEINQIFKTVAGGILLIDKQFNILRHNEAFLRMAGATAQAARSRKCYEVFPSSQCHTPECPVQKIKKGAERLENDLEMTGPDGGTVYYHVLATPFRGPAGDLIGIVEHITDVTSRVLAEKALQASECRYKELSSTDELTGLFNKRHFNQHLEMEVARARRYGHPLSLMIMDIDNFKQYNDTYGHPAGDLVLAALGKLLKKSLRLNDLACRYGGEEFVVILPETEGETALMLAERIRERFAALEFTPAEQLVVRVTLSLGVSQLKAEESGPALLQRADQNLYAAKHSGRNRTVYT